MAKVYEFVADGMEEVECLAVCDWELGLVKGHRATCYPGFETKMEGADCRGDGIITDRLISTGRGMGWAIDLGLELIKLLVSEEEAERIKAAIQYIK